MSSKKKNPTSPDTNPQAIKIGSRVRCTDDGVEGRIVWANAVSVKIRWDDGEQVTWRRDSLADRPIEILDAAGSEEQQAAPDASEETVSEPLVEHATTSSASAEQPSEPIPDEPTTMPEDFAPEQPPTTDTQVEEARPSEQTQQALTPPERTTEQPETPSAISKQPRTRKPKRAADDGKEKKLSALDAAAKVLADAGQAMNCQEMIAAMAEKGYWTSPGGKTPAATLYSAILRELTTKGSSSRFIKAERGQFALANPA